MTRFTDLKTESQYRHELTICWQMIEQDREALARLRAELAERDAEIAGLRQYKERNAGANRCACRFDENDNPLSECGHHGPIRRELESLRQRVKALIDAAGAVVARWESPDWSDGTHTRDYIHRLRDALAAAEGAKT